MWLMILVEICSITGPLMGMPFKANHYFKRFEEWASDHSVKYEIGETNRFIRFDEKNFVIFALQYSYEYKVIDGP